MTVELTFEKIHQAVAIDGNDNILVADRNNNRFSLCTFVRRVYRGVRMVVVEGVLSVCMVCSYLNIYIYIYVYAYMYIYYIHMHTHTRTHPYTRTHTHTHTRTLSLCFSLSHTRTDIHVNKHAHTPHNSQGVVRVFVCDDAIHEHTRTRIHTHKHTCKHKHKHTQTHTRAPTTGFARSRASLRVWRRWQVCDSYLGEIIVFVTCTWMIQFFTFKSVISCDDPSRCAIRI